MLFKLVMLPALLVLALTSYTRLAYLAVQDAYYARATGRIRAFYLTFDPAGLQYWMQPAGDNAHAVTRPSVRSTPAGTTSPTPRLGRGRDLGHRRCTGGPCSQRLQFPVRPCGGRGGDGVRLGTGVTWLD